MEQLESLVGWCKPLLHEFNTVEFVSVTEVLPVKVQCPTLLDNQQNQRAKLWGLLGNSLDSRILSLY